MKTGAIILAAGMPENIKVAKAMLCLGGKPMIKRIVNSLEELQLEPIVVVTGYRADIIERCLADARVKLVKNRQFADTKMLDSLKLGLAALGSSCDRALIFPADIPMVSTKSLKKILSSKAPVLRPRYGEQYGHPLLISRELFESVLSYEGENGLEGWLQEQQTQCMELEDEGIILEANSYEDFEKLLAQEEIRHGKGQLHMLCEAKLAVDDVIMDTDIMHLLEMLEYTGSLKLSSELLRLPYTSSWRQIKALEEQLGISVIDSSTGGAKGGGSRLPRQGRELLAAYRRLQADLKRMGSWIFKDHFSDDFVENLQNLD